MREVVHYFHYTDGKTLTVTATGEDVGKHTLLHTHHRRIAASPLFVYYATLLVYLLTVEDKTVCPVVENPQTRVNGTLYIHGHIVDVIHSLIYCCISIKISTELYADTLKIVDKRFAREVFCAVEAHVLKEVGKTTLVLFLLD